MQRPVRNVTRLLIHSKIFRPFHIYSWGLDKCFHSLCVKIAFFTSKFLLQPETRPYLCQGQTSNTGDVLDPHIHTGGGSGNTNEVLKRGYAATIRHPTLQPRNTVFSITAVIVLCHTFEYWITKIISICFRSLSYHHSLHQ